MSFKNHKKIFTSLPDILKLQKLQKNVWDLQALKESFKNDTKIFTSLPDILKLLQLQKNVWDLQALQEFIKKSYKNIYNLARHFEAFTTSEKYFGSPGTPGVF